MLSQINNKIKTFDQNKIQHDKVIEPILTPDHFLPASKSESYYSRKYDGNLNLNFKSKFRKISQVASVMLLSLGFLATAVEVKAQPNTASGTISLDTIASNSSFLLGNGSEGTSTNVPLPPKMPQSLLAEPFDSATTQPAAAPVPPTPPAAPAMPDLLSDAGSSKSNKKTALLQSIRDFGGKLFKLKKVKEEPTTIMVPKNWTTKMLE